MVGNTAFLIAGLAQMAIGLFVAFYVWRNR